MYSVRLYCDGVDPDTGDLMRKDRDSNCSRYLKTVGCGLFIRSAVADARGAARAARWKEVPGALGKPTRWYCGHCQDRFEWPRMLREIM